MKSETMLVNTGPGGDLQVVRIYQQRVICWLNLFFTETNSNYIGLCRIYVGINVILSCAVIRCVIESLAQ